MNKLIVSVQYHATEPDDENIYFIESVKGKYNEYKVGQLLDDSDLNDIYHNKKNYNIKIIDKYNPKITKVKYNDFWISGEYPLAPENHKFCVICKKIVVGQPIFMDYLIIADGVRYLATICNHCNEHVQLEIHNERHDMKKMYHDDIPLYVYPGFVAPVRSRNLSFKLRLHLSRKYGVNSGLIDLIQGNPEHSSQKHLYFTLDK